MNTLETALLKAPHTWSLDYEYNEHPYKLFDINWTEENKIIENFPPNTINSIKRIQHISQYALFQISKNKKQKSYDNFYEVVGYHIINECDLETSLIFPLDYRRYKGPMKHICKGFNKQPKFWKTAKEAIIAGENFQCKKNIIICNILSSNEDIHTEMQWDYYPTYVVSLF